MPEYRWMDAPFLIPSVPLLTLFAEICRGSCYPMAILESAQDSESPAVKRARILDDVLVSVGAWATRPERQILTSMALIPKDTQVKWLSALRPITILPVLWKIAG